MKNKIIIIGIIILGAAFGVYFWIKTSSPSNQLAQSHSGHSHSKSQYICPMHPQITSDKPDTCPICGMDLVPADSFDEEDEEEEVEQDSEKQGAASTGAINSKPTGRTEIKLSLNRQQMIGVKTGKIERRDLFKKIRAPGRIAFDPELYTIQSEYLEALRQWKSVKNSPIEDVKRNTQQMIRSSRTRLKVMGLSDEQIQDLARKGSQSDGLLVGGSDNTIYADIYEVDLPYIKTGESAQITANFLQGRSLPGKVMSVDRVINPETRTAKVRIKLLKSDPAIRPESFVNVEIFAPVGNHLSIPTEALIDTGLETFVFIKKANGRFEPKRVQILIETEERIGIAGPVQAGDEVVVGANFLLDSESRLKAVISEGASN